MSDVPVALRVKRRRDCAAVPAEIIIETSSRPASAQDALASALQQTLAVSSNQLGVAAPPEGPAKKRCRYVLVSGLASATAAPDSDSSAVAGPLERQAPANEGPILELWHTAGLRETPAAAGSSGSIRSQAAVLAPRQLPSMPAMLEQRGGIYASMLQEYMQEQQQQHQQQQQKVGPGTTATQQQRPHRGPSKRAHHSSSNTPSSSSTAPAASQQQQQQQPQLPSYMTKGMLKHYGLWQGSHSQQQQQQQHHVATPNPADLQHSAQNTAAAAAGDIMDAEYTYDVYVAAPVDSHGVGNSSSSRGQGAEASGHAAAAAAGGSSSVQQGSCAVDDGLLGLEAALEMPVVQVWEDELVQLQLDWALAQDAAADDGESEDSNAEDYYANDYPDEDDCSQHNSLDSSDAEDEQSNGRYNGHFGRNDIIGFYQPGSSRKARGGKAKGQGESTAGAYGGYESSESFDCDDYVSSGDEACGDREDMGPAWMRKHCVGYGETDGGQAWRSVLAHSLAPAGSKP